MNKKNASLSMLGIFLLISGTVVQGQQQSNTDKSVREQKTCDITKPPKEAKLTKTHPMDFYIWPNPVPPNFTGCRHMWLAEGQEVGIWIYEKGNIVAVLDRGPDEDSKWEVCKYNNNQLSAGSSSICEKVFKD